MTDQHAASEKHWGAPSIRVSFPPQLARNEKGQLTYPYQEMPKAKEMLFAALESFANLGDTIGDLQSFRQQYPEFDPIGISRAQPQLPQGGLSDALHALILGLRNVLRIVWRHGADSDQWFLDTLLGLNRPLYEEGLRLYEADPNFPGFLSEAALRSIQPYRHLINYSEIHAQWGTGDFQYITAELFHKAVYQLFRENWRARICPQCARYFIAGKPPQLYCSTTCYGSAKRKRDLKWWRTEGAAKRRQKQPEAQARPKKSQRNRGK